MIEATDEMVQLALDIFLDTPPDSIAQIDAGMGKALAAVLAIVERDYDVRDRAVVHLATKGDGNMHCCGRTPFELPRGDRMTLDPHGANCQGPYT